MRLSATLTHLYGPNHSDSPHRSPLPLSSRASHPRAVDYTLKGVVGKTASLTVYGCGAPVPKIGDVGVFLVNGSLAQPIYEFQDPTFGEALDTLRDAEP